MRRFEFSLTISLMLVGSLFMALYQIQAQPEVVWGKQWGSGAKEGSCDIARDRDNNIYVSGVTEGNLFGQNQGGMDIFVVKLDSGGQVLWSKQFGTKDDEEGASLSIDATGSVYLATSTRGAWFGENLGDKDIVLLKLSADGQLIWGKRIGTDKDEVVHQIVVDRQGYIYAVGWTSGNLFGQNQRGDYEGLLAKFDLDGKLALGKQFKDDLPNAIAVDSQCNIYIGGWTYDNVSNTFVGFLAKFTSDGTLKWKQVLPPTEEVTINSLSIDRNGNVYLVGQVEVYVDENQLVSVPDAFVAKYNGADGQRLWSKHFRSQEQSEQGEIFEVFDDVTIDEQGNIYVVGSAEGSLFGSNLGERDVVIVKIDAQGNIIWGKQWGSAKGESGVAIAIDETGSIYVAGGTNGNLFGTNAGEAGIFVVKFRQ